ncbi:single-stranded-DNA-specific exonuclease RecJ [Candidatus Sumerlaeota bacterium]|nr:single-stranded-DNA-specific exonuclease RecJ [Candidatus Sumerlaeota bacterium]
MNTPTTRSPTRPWHILPQDDSTARRFEADCGLGPVAARVMAARGWTDPEALRDFLTNGLSSLSDPLSLPDMAAAADRLTAAIAAGEHICIYGDYDVDGTTGSAVLLRTMRWLGVEHVTHETPHRVHEGYGLKPEAVDRLADEGVDLIVTVDNGTTAHPALERARERGIDVIVTDHHQLDTSLPPAVALVNPWRIESDTAFRDLCGCAVAFKLAMALAKAMGRDAEEAKPFLLSLLDLVAVATVADMVTLLGENRAIVRYGLSHLHRSENLGLRALIDVADLQGGVSAENIGWVLGPRINAAGRTDHASVAVELLTTEDPQRAKEIALELERLNRERRQIEAAIVEQAIEELESHRDDPVIILARPGWHIGVLGIVASRILERAERPTILLAIERDIARGSGRSVPGFDMHAALTACRDHLEGFGGHPMAAGVTCLPSKIEDFRRAMIAHAESLGPDALGPRPLVADTELAPDELCVETLEDIARLGPHGDGHRRPQFVLRELELAATPQVLKRTHLKFRFLLPNGRPLTAMAWRRADRLGELLPSPRRMDIIGQPTLNEWQGQRTVEFTVRDWRVTEP